MTPSDKEEAERRYPNTIAELRRQLDEARTECARWQFARDGERENSRLLARRAEAAERQRDEAWETARERRDEAYRQLQRAEAAERALAETRCPIGLDDTPVICSAGTCFVCVQERLAEARAMSLR